MHSKSLENYNFQKIIAGVSVTLFAIKFAAWYLTGSIAIFTDAMESIVNVIGGFVGLYSLYLSALPKDKNHPYGHGKIEFVSAGVEGSLITIAGIAIIYKSTLALFNPQPIKELDYGIYLVLFSAVVNYGVGYFAVRKGKKNSSLALVASGKHLQTDTYTTIGIIIGLIALRFTGKGWLDAGTAILFATIIIYQGVKIVRHSLAGIMDEADTQLISEVVDHLNKNRRVQWIDLHKFRIVKYGAVYHIDCHLTVPWYINVKNAHDEANALEQLVVDKFEGNVEMSVHIEDCHPEACSFCAVEECPERAYPLVKRVVWSADIVARAKRRLLS